MSMSIIVQNTLMNMAIAICAVSFGVAARILILHQVACVLIAETNIQRTTVIWMMNQIITLMIRMMQIGGRMNAWKNYNRVNALECWRGAWDKEMVGIGGTGCRELI